MHLTAESHKTETYVQGSVNNGKGIQINTMVSFGQKPDRTPVIIGPLINSEVCSGGLFEVPGEVSSELNNLRR